VSAALPRLLAEESCSIDAANMQLQRPATIRVLRPPEDVAQLAEGDVVLVTALAPATRAGAGVLELQVGGGRRWARRCFRCRRGAALPRLAVLRCWRRRWRLGSAS
jgi:hypothetical protein